MAHSPGIKAMAFDAECVMATASADEAAAAPAGQVMKTVTASDLGWPQNVIQQSAPQILQNLIVPTWHIISAAAARRILATYAAHLKLGHTAVAC